MLTLALEALFGQAVQHRAAVIAERGRRVRVLQPLVDSGLHLLAVHSVS